MLRSTLVFAMAAISAIAMAEPHLGFEVQEWDGQLVVSAVHPKTEALSAGVSLGDIVVNVAGTYVKTEKEFLAVVAKRRPGATVGIRLKRDKDVIAMKLKAIDRAQILQTLADLKREEDKERDELHQREQEERRKKAERIATRGAICPIKGSVQMNVINQPEIFLEIGNESEEWIEAIEFRVAMFDKFGRPVEGLFGSSHEKTFLHQEEVPPLGSVKIRAPVPWHSTVGKADVTIVRYIRGNGKIVVPPDPWRFSVER